MTLDREPRQAPSAESAPAEGAGPRVALVTGGTSGIGLEIARMLRDDGMRVAITGRSHEKGRDAAASLGDAVRFIRSDATDPSAPDACVERVLGEFGRLDVLVNNAGRRHAGLIVDTPAHELEAVLRDNTVSAMAMTAAAARAMSTRGGGAIINVLSRLATIGMATVTAYSASKGALLAYTRGAAIELAPHGIRVNAVAPGMTSTPLIDDWLAHQDDPDGALAEIVGDVPLGRLATPEDVAGAVAYLASERAAYLTGVSIAVDGGYTAR